jgi:hypothetical protein
MRAISLGEITLIISNAYDKDGRNGEALLPVFAAHRPVIVQRTKKVQTADGL